MTLLTGEMFAYQWRSWRVRCLLTNDALGEWLVLEGGEAEVANLDAAGGPSDEDIVTLQVPVDHRRHPGVKEQQPLTKIKKDLEKQWIVRILKKNVRIVFTVPSIQCWGSGAGSTTLVVRLKTETGQNQCCGSGSISTRYRTDPDLDPSIISKNSKKNLDSYCFVTSLWLLILKNDVNVVSKSHKQKKKLLMPSWRTLTKIAGSGSVPKCHGSATLVKTTHLISSSHLEDLATPGLEHARIDRLEALQVGLQSS